MLSLGKWWHFWRRPTANVRQVDSSMKARYILYSIIEKHPWCIVGLLYLFTVRYELED
jgi:hypothetical protein